VNLPVSAVKRHKGVRKNAETNQPREQLKDPEWASYILCKTLLGRFGRPEEAARVALFLALADSSCVTGVDIVVDGGMKAWWWVVQKGVTPRLNTFTAEQQYWMGSIIPRSALVRWG
jgi:hypothetical protein